MSTLTRRAVSRAAHLLLGVGLLVQPAALAAQSLLDPIPAIDGGAGQTTRPTAKVGTQPASQTTQPSTQPGKESGAQDVASADSLISPKATFLFGNARIHNDPTILWPGLLNGLRGFEHFYEPVGNPIYFESPFNNTSLRFLYLYHDFPDGSQIGGGEANVFALQVRVALTERLGFIATKDGYTRMNAGILPPDDGWNDFAIGLKYVLIADRENDFVLTTGMRWEWENGDRRILQGRDQELSPFISFAKGWGPFHLLGDVTGRLPMDIREGNYILQWDLHADYEILPEVLPGFAPLFEVHGLHYLSDGDALPLAVGGLDYTNLGSTNVAGDFVIWGGAGCRWKLSPHLSLGATYEFPFHNPNNDIMEQRVTVDMILTW